MQIKTKKSTLKLTLSLRWNTVNWPKIQLKVFKWQRSIYSASKLGNIKQVRLFQHKLLNSLESKLLAVRRVTQDNKGKATAGVDNVKSISPENRIKLVESLNFPCKASPLRRVWIPKPGKTEKRPLGIPTIKDRCLQALFKLAIEPEWEAKFEPNSYGFRPGRNCHDAISAIKDTIQKKAKYVVDADIKKCFDKIAHEPLLNKIGLKGKYRKQLKYWLESGVLDNGSFAATTAGTPQGGVISPLLSNIALHGMEECVKELVTEFPMTWASGEKIKKGRRRDTVHLIRYADDFVILHHDKDILLACLNKIKEFLSQVGLEISESKTRLTHTFALNPNSDLACEGFDGITGFNFLGFTFKQFKSKFQTAHSTTGKPLGFRTLVYPSKEKQLKYQEKLHEITLGQGKRLNQVALIKKLNPIIRGWANYFGRSDAATMHILTKMDYLLYLKLRRWAKRVKGTSGKGRSCWEKVGNSNWVFKKDGVTLLYNTNYSNPIDQYVKVKGESSPYDENPLYWAKRLNSNPTFNTRTRTLLKTQKGCCNICKLQFTENDVLEVDHIFPRHLGGKDVYSNLQLLHRHCHHKKTQADSLLSKLTPKNSLAG